MQERHFNREQYFREQSITSEKYVIPYISQFIEINEDTSVLEIGCGEGGNLVPFLAAGCKRIVGVDLSKGRIENARKFFDSFEGKENIEFIIDNIYNMDSEKTGRFDIIIMRDVIEHIPGQEQFMEFVKGFLKPGGKFFLGFPPWYNPFGGHQQMCKSKILSKLPYFHILPAGLYKFILKSFGESESKIGGLLEVKETGISIERFEKIIKATGYKIDNRTLYFINPNYEIKFNLKPRVAWKIVASIPFIRNFLVTAGYYLISVE